MPVFASSPIPTGGAEATRAADVLPLPFTARPQAMTVYTRHVELGTILTGTGLWHIGAADNSDPRLFMFQLSPGGYAIRHDNGTGLVQSTVATLPSIGDGVELLAAIASDGSLQLTQSINGAQAESAAQSSVLRLGTAWSGSLLWLNSLAGPSIIGFAGFRNVAFHRGVQSLETMRRLAGV